MGDDLSVVQAGVVELWRDIADKAEAEGLDDVASAARKMVKTAKFFNNYMLPDGLLERISSEYVPVKISVGDDVSYGIAELNPCYVLRAACRLIVQVSGPA